MKKEKYKAPETIRPIEYQEEITIRILDACDMQYIKLSPAAKTIYKILTLDNDPGTMSDLSYYLEKKYGYRRGTFNKAVKELQNKKILRYRITEEYIKDISAPEVRPTKTS